MTVALRKQNSRSHAERFPAEEFTRIPGVIVFAEHSTTLRDGTPVTYDRDALEKIARNCNRRIEETGNYAAVCLGHIYESVSAKPLIGFAGPFRVEDQGGRAVIAADFWIFKDDAKQLKRYPRPSPEVWIPLDGFDPDRIFLDPIAMLGAETPRLDLGTYLYTARAGDLVCEKYAATLASPEAVSVPTLESDTNSSANHERYAMANLQPDDIRAILKAIEATDWYRWIRSQMAASAKPDADADANADDADAPPKDKPTAKSFNDDADDAPPADRHRREPYPEGEPPSDGAPPGDDPDEPTDDDKRRPRRVDEYRRTSHYARRDDVLHAQREIYELRQAVERERALRINTERRRALENLSRRYALDVDEELQRARYGRMSDDEFRRHLSRIERYHRQLPVGQELPIWGESYSEPDGSRETYQRKQQEELSQKAVDLVNKLASRGEWISYDEAMERIKGKV